MYGDWERFESCSCGHPNSCPPCGWCENQCECGEQLDDGYCSNCDQYEYFEQDELINYRDKTMNPTAAITVIRDDVRGIEVTFDDDNSGSKYIFKSFDKNIVTGDLVLIPTKTAPDVKSDKPLRTHHVCIARVTDVDVDINIESSIVYKWVISRLILDGYMDIINQEESLVQEVNKLVKSKKRRELQAEYKNILGEDFSKLPQILLPDSDTIK